MNGLLRRFLEVSFMLIILLVFLLIAAIVVVLYIRQHGSRERIRALLEHLAASMQIEEAVIQKLPTMELGGKYRTYHLTVECVFKSGEGYKKMQNWQIITDLHVPSKLHLYIQSEQQEGKLRKVMGLDIITTDDEWFDRHFLVFSSDAERIRRSFNPYMRQRFFWAGFKDFTLEVKDKDVSIELLLPPDTNVRSIRHSIEVLTEYLNILETI